MGDIEPLKIYGYCFIFLFPVFLVLGLGLLGWRFSTCLIMACITCAGATVVVNIATDKLGDISKVLYGGGRQSITKREQLAGTLKVVKVIKMNKSFQEALDAVDEILEQDSEFYEAMLVKAQILIEGFNEPESAKPYLRSIMMNTSKTESLYTWASSLYRENFHSDKQE